MFENNFTAALFLLMYSILQQNPAAVSTSGFQTASGQDDLSVCPHTTGWQQSSTAVLSSRNTLVLCIQC